MIEDAELLRRYAETRSEEAFAELVRRRIGLVYSVALRQTGGDAHRAQDVAQMVFTDLARKASTLAGRPVLLGWLYRSAQYAASQTVRTETRRRHREEEAHIMNELHGSPGPTPDWDQLRPRLDQVLDELNERDRDAVLLRFFDGRTFAEIGSRLHLTENAARMRVERALDKLHALLAQRGITSTTAALGLALTSQAAIAAPTGLAAAVSASAVASAAGTASAGVIATFMSSIKLQTSLAAVIVVAGTTGALVQSNANDVLRQQLAHAPSALQVAALQVEVQKLSQISIEAEQLREVDSELAQLRDEIGTVSARQREAAQKVAAIRAQRAAAKASGPVYSIAQLDQHPKPRRQVPPVYPHEMRRIETEGEATISFIVDPDGLVMETTATSATHPDFATAAIEAVSQWEFNPGQKGGLPVNVRMQVPIRFTINKDGGAGPGLNNWF
jgi:RNA polymerase sigma factor (sigma-70 family)